MSGLFSEFFWGGGLPPQSPSFHNPLALLLQAEKYLFILFSVSKPTSLMLNNSSSIAESPC